MSLEEEFSQTELEKAQKFYDFMEILKQTYWKRDDLKEINNDEIDC